MKEKILNYAKGEFTFIQPEIRVSIDSINLSIEAGNQIHDSFIISNQKGTVIKAILYSSSCYLVLENDQVVGNENVINYTINATYLDVGDEINGTISIISDCGEMRLPFLINVAPPQCETSIGPIKDLFQFANLAKINWDEAVKVFSSEKFRKVLEYYNKKHITIYKHLINSPNLSISCEEFLIAVHKKLRITYKVDKTSLIYDDLKDSFKDSITLTKDMWGYNILNTFTDNSFVELEKNAIYPDDFVNNNCKIDFVINPDKMRKGKNFANIFIGNMHQTIRIEIICNKPYESDVDFETTRKIKKYKLRLTKNYFDYCFERISQSKFLAEAKSFLSILKSLDDNIIYELIEIYSFILAGKENSVSSSVKELALNIDRFKDNPTIHGIILYFQAKLTKESKQQSNIFSEIRMLFDHNSDDYLLALIINELDNRANINKTMKLEALKIQIEHGNVSPICFNACVKLINSDPSILRSIDFATLQILNFGAKHKIFTKEACSQIAYVSTSYRYYNRLLFRILASLYAKQKSKELLFAICSMLIKGKIKDNKYHIWYELGVNEQLRLRELHEYFIYSSLDKIEKPIPVQVFTYFSFNIQLDDDKKAYIYANLITFKEQYQNIYMQQERSLINFANEQLKKGNISANLAIIYEAVYKDRLLDNESANYLSYLMFKHEVTCDNSNIKALIAVHKELKLEEIVVFENGRAIVDIFTDDVEIILLDKYNNRYCSSVEVATNRLLNIDERINPFLKLDSNNQRLLLNMLNETHYSRTGERLANIYKLVLQNDNLEADFKRECEQKLIHYFYDAVEGEQLESYLLKLDFENLSRAQRVTMIEYMIIRQLYNSALIAIKSYGYEAVNIKSLLRLTARLVNMQIDEKNKQIIKDIAIYAFSKGKSNAESIRFLANNYYGSTSSLYEIWLKAREMDIDTTIIEEKLLSQILFSESYVADIMSLFRNYYSHGANQKLVRACLSYYAYRYLLNDRMIDNEFFDIMKRELNYEENEICLLALLKYYTKFEKLSSQDVNFINHNLNILMKKGKLLPFMKQFKCSEIQIPQSMLDKHYVEYHAESKDKIKIHYLYEDSGNDETFKKESMTNIGYGIFVTEFVIFYNEFFQYYITNESTGDDRILESGEIILEPAFIGDEETKYQQLNLIITAREMNDEKTALRMLEGYIRNEYRIDKLFSPL